MRDTSVSTGVRKELGELFRWCQVSERLARPAVEARRDAGQVVVQEWAGWYGLTMADVTLRQPRARL
jgi:hypothetical protein